MSRLNVGCGGTPTPGWKNYDNSWSVRLARWPVVAMLFGKLGGFRESRKFIAVVKQSGIRWADATRRIPEPDRSADVLYSSHMVEHLNKDQAMRFLKEARRVLVPGGIIRIAVPDVRYHVNNYLQDQDADRFIEATLLVHPRPNTWISKLKYLLVGDRHHMWMYDGASLCKLLSSAGFQNPRVMEPGTTMIQEPGELNLREREPESVFVEAVNA
ncbi:MAG: methyltransferase domain-containing protein [Pirellulales bacterium]|nr:methyltransferase domain-containing protein [Pirellulales bacterium]